MIGYFEDEDEDDVEREPRMATASFRLPVDLIAQVDRIAKQDRRRRADVVRLALARYVAERTEPVSRDDAEHALDVLRRLVSARDTAASDAEGPAADGSRD